MKTRRFFLTLAIIGMCFSSLSGIVPAHCQTLMSTVNEQNIDSPRYQNSIETAARKFDLPVSWISAVITVESNWNERAVSPAGAIGLMQVMPQTYDEMRQKHGLGSDPFNAHDNIMAGTAYLKQMHEQYGRQGFLAAYNAGPGRYRKHLNSGDLLPHETRRYVARLEALFDGRPSSRMIAGRDATAPSWAASPLFAGGNFSGVLAAKARHQNTQPDDASANRNADASPAVMSRNEPAGRAAADTSEEALPAASDDVVSALAPHSGTLFAINQKRSH